MIHVMRRLLAAFGVVTASALAAPSAAAFDFPLIDPAPLLRIDPSARARAMGGASGALFWGDLDGWANPALLGLARGIRYEHERTDLFSDIRYDARRVVLGWGGVGVALAGRPLAGTGGLRYHGDFEVSLGGPPVVFQFDDQVKSWAVGVSAAQMVATIAEMHGGQAPGFTRLGDVALGFSHKAYTSTLGSFSQTASAMDWGLLVRTGAGFTAYESQFRVDVAYGYSVQNANDAEVGGAGNAWRPHRHATSARLTIDPPAMSERRAAWGLHPLIALGGTWDNVSVTADGSRVSKQTGLGAEIGLANVAFVRFGEGPGSSATTWGYGLALPIGNLARIRYDHAEISTGVIEDTPTDGWSVWVDVMGVVATWR